MNTENLIWEKLNNDPLESNLLESWLIDDASLTKKLKQKFADFSVKVLSEIQGKAHNNEQDLLGTQADCIIREVELWGNQHAVVFARSIIPITDDTQNLLGIGSKPLGEILFNDASIARGELQITRMGDVWGRRSTFAIGDTRVLVSEFFLEALYA
ncbi:MAG: Chorismate pyruvate-lyase [Catillopecten margaritatus gill symbiont]|uniref:Probable chorismate pyruvate-lyase n=1 Tax=Catillopecten margaritatus gill symbiont TaxID=3083288 RepID=A0AAU6PH61_9GAMM